MADSTPYVVMQGITKRYPGVVALDHLDFTANRGEVMALVGENGAGKSSLLKVLAGAVRADEGKIQIDGKPVTISHPRDAQRLGIAVIYQELNLANHLSVAENIFLGRTPSRGGFVNFKAMAAETAVLLKDLGIKATPSSIVGQLNVANRQMVEIAKAVSTGARVIVMDEPTSSLTEHEVQTLMDLIRELRRRDVVVIYVSHRMKEIFEIADRITVMRDGKLVGVRDRGEVAPSQIVSMMVGRDLEDLFGERQTPVVRENPVLEVRDLAAAGLVKEVSFELFPGEILGMAGLIGAGRSETAHAIFGALPLESGQVFLEGEEIKCGHPREAIEHGLALVPEDRKQQGLFLGLPVRANMSSASLDTLSKVGLIDRAKEKALARDQATALNLRQNALEVAAGTLSGGNQQKVVLGRWLARSPKVLILDEPTRGVDVGAKAEIYRIIRAAAERGVGVIVISSELLEVLGISDRILVMHEGRLVAQIMAENATEEQVIHLATGVGESS